MHSLLLIAPIIGAGGVCIPGFSTKKARPRILNVNQAVNKIPGNLYG